MPRRNLLVDWGGQTLLNLGDLAMVMVAIERLAERFPGARIAVTSHRPEAFRRFCPQAEPIPEEIVQSLFWRRLLPAMVTRFLPIADAFEEAAFRRFPLRSLRLRVARHFREPDRRAAALEILETLAGADLVLAAGGGYLTDAFPGYLLRIVGLLTAAIHLGKPVVLVGQGLGPIEDPKLRRRVAPVLRHASMITLREGLLGPALLRELGGLQDRVEVTGDDAIELVRAHEPPRGPESGRHLGFNLRIARYAQTDVGSLGWIGETLERFALRRGVSILPCPIDLGEHGDTASVRAVMGASQTLNLSDLPTDPAGLVAQIARCRVVVTASYHAAVFALAQGIPAVAVARSPYYHAKFEGLRDQFGSACRIVSLKDSQDAVLLDAALNEAWEGAGTPDREARRAADRQVAASRAAYDRLPGLVGTDPASRGSKTTGKGRYLETSRTRVS